MVIVDTLPANFLVRTPTMDDLRAVSELIEACDIADYGTPEITQEDLRSSWLGPNFHLETDAWVVSTSEGRVVGYADAEDREHVRIYAFIRVHPDYWGQRIENCLLQLTEARARQHVPLARPDARVSVLNWTSSVNKAAQQLFEQAGYKHVRSNWTMEIEMDKEPLEPAWPEGIKLHPFVPDQDEHAVFEMIDEAFSDHWGYMPEDFENWKHWMIEREDFDPSLWFLAVDGNEVAGGALCKYERDIGWVSQLAVRRPWRRRGLGMALLHHSFGEFYRRGRRKVGLGVDSQNLTGATRLYLQAGMHVARQYDTYEKELRGGVELSTQAIAT